MFFSGDPQLSDHSHKLKNGQNNAPIPLREEENSRYKHRNPFFSDTCLYNGSLLSGEKNSKLIEYKRRLSDHNIHPRNAKLKLRNSLNMRYESVIHQNMMHYNIYENVDVLL